MKTKLFICFISIILLIMPFCSSCFATENALDSSTSSDDDSLIASESTNYEFSYSDYIRINENIASNQVIDGNVFIFGNDITISGVIYGDLVVVATNSINIENTAVAYGNIYAYAPSITMSGATSDVYFLSNNVIFGNSSYIARNINVYSSNIAIKGNITRNANLYTDNLIVDDSAKIGGDINYSSEKEFEINQDLVSGNINYTKLVQNSGNIAMSILYSCISALVFAFVVIMLLLWIAPKFQDRASDIISKRPLLSLGIGLIAFFGIIIVSLILLLFAYRISATLPVAMLLLLILAFAVSQIIFSIGLGKFICNKLNMQKTIAYVLFALLITVVVKLLVFIPYVGGYIGFVISIIGLGMLFINSYKRKDLVAKPEN